MSGTERILIGKSPRVGGGITTNGDARSRGQKIARDTARVFNPKELTKRRSR